MSDRPYTDNDLQIEAARQYATLTENPDFMGVGEQMEDAAVEHTDDGDTFLTWTELLVPQGAGASYEAFGEAQRQIHGLINGAADTSVWAVSLGVDGLEPVTDVIDFPSATLDADFARMHFAFHPDVPADTRTHVINRIRTILAANL